jgi:quercetin dioxygenase-like cupin family protein
LIAAKKSSLFERKSKGAALFPNSNKNLKRTKQLMNYKIESNNVNWKSGQVKGFLGKEFIQLANGGVKLVKIEPLAVYPEHIHPDKTEYAYIIEGNPQFVIDNQVFEGKIGDFFIFPNNVKHAIKNNTIDECYLLIGSIKI